jgi:hypothetical protein
LKLDENVGVIGTCKLVWRGLTSNLRNQIAKSYDQGEPVEVQECKKITDHFRGIYRIYPNFILKNPEDVNM